MHLAPDSDERACSASGSLGIVVLSDFAYVHGGASSVAIMSAKELARRGHHVTFFSAIGPVDPSLAESGVDVVCLGQEIVKPGPARLLHAARAVWNADASEQLKTLLSSSPRGMTVAHLHGWTRGLSPSISRMLIRNHIPLVATLHDYFLACPNGGFYDYTAQQICKRTAYSFDCLQCNCGPGGKQAKAWRVFRGSVQRVAGGLPSRLRHVISISPLSESVLRPYLRDDVSVHSISNPVDIRQAPRADVGRHHDLIVVGRISAAKGQLLAAEAGRRANMRIRFVGDGEFADRIRKEYPEHEVTGWLGREDVERQLNNARALVFPSLWYENQPLVILEAASRGLPSLVADTCAGRDSIVDKQSGFLFRGGDVDHLAEVMKQLRDDALVDEMGRLAYDNYWSMPPTINKHCNELEACYYSMLEFQGAQA